MLDRCRHEPLITSDYLPQVMLVNGEPPTQRTAGAFLSALKLSGRSDHCAHVFKEMVEMGVDVGNVCFNIVISALVQVRSAPFVHEFIRI